MSTARLPVFGNQQESSRGFRVNLRNGTIPAGAREPAPEPPAAADQADQADQDATTLTSGWATGVQPEQVDQTPADDTPEAEPDDEPPEPLEIATKVVAPAARPKPAGPGKPGVRAK